MNSAYLNDAQVPFQTAHRDEHYSTGPVMATVVAPPIDLSFHDLVAALFRWDWIDPDTPDDEVRALIVESVINNGCMCLQETLEGMTAAERRPGTAAHAWLQFCRQRVTDLFSMPARTSSVRDGSHLVGVA